MVVHKRVCSVSTCSNVCLIEINQLIKVKSFAQALHILSFHRIFKHILPCIDTNKLVRTSVKNINYLDYQIEFNLEGGVIK